MEWLHCKKTWVVATKKENILMCCPENIKKRRTRTHAKRKRRLPIIFLTISDHFFIYIFRKAIDFFSGKIKQKKEEEEDARKKKEAVADKFAKFKTKGKKSAKFAKGARMAPPGTE